MFFSSSKIIIKCSTLHVLLIESKSTVTPYNVFVTGSNCDEYIVICNNRPLDQQSLLT